MAKKDISYNDALNELESIVGKLENESTDVDDLTKLVNRAKELVSFCRNKLRDTEEQLKSEADK